MVRGRRERETEIEREKSGAREIKIERNRPNLGMATDEEKRRRQTRGIIIYLTRYRFLSLLLFNFRKKLQCSNAETKMNRIIAYGSKRTRSLIRSEESGVV